MLEHGKIEFGIDENRIPTLKRYLNETEGQVMPSVIYRDRRAAMKRLRTLLGGEYFDNPKDDDVLSKLIEGVTSANDLILDFFAGSGTTAQAVMELNKEDGGNRKFILVQLPETTAEDSEAAKAGFANIAEITRERIRRVINKLEKEKETKLDFTAADKSNVLGFRSFRLANSNFKIWRSDAIENEDDLTKQTNLFINPQKENSEELNILWELIVKLGRSLSASVEELTLDDCKVYSIESGEIFFVLNKVSKKLAKEIAKLKPKLCICLDSLFAQNDCDKANFQLQCEDNATEFKSV